MFYTFFCVIPWRLPTFRNTLFHLLHLSAYEDETECSEKSAYKIQTPGNYPEESIKQLKKI
jgi:hypothetical protein